MKKKKKNLRVGKLDKDEKELESVTNVVIYFLTLYTFVYTTM